MVDDYPAALLALLQANYLLPDDSRILYYLGKSYSGLEEYSDAALTFRKALKVGPEDPEIYFALGNVGTHFPLFNFVFQPT